MGHIEIAPFNLTGHAEAVLSVMTTALGLGDRGNEERARIVRRHAERPGLITCGAFAGDRLFGLCYGFPCDDSAWWERQVRPHLLAAGTVDWLAGCGSFELTELHVHPDYQGNGWGRRLITKVLGETPLPRAVLSVRSGAHPARRLYESLGFRAITAPFQFDAGQPGYLVMGATLPVPASLVSTLR